MKSNYCKRRGILTLVGMMLVSWTSNLTAQDKVVLNMGNPGPYRMIERSDWRRRDNGKPVGLVYREVVASIIPEQEEQGSLRYRGNFFVVDGAWLSERKTLQVSNSRRIDRVVPVNFRLSGKGDLSIEDDKGFPSFRGFPVFPKEALSSGSRWTSRAVRAVDPLNEGKVTLVPITAEYTYKGMEEYRGTMAHRVTAKYASRYQASTFEIDEGKFSALEGTHDVVIMIRASDGLPLLIQDKLDETYTWPNGNKVQFLGSTLIFGENTLPLNRGATIANLRQSLDKPGGSGGPGGGKAPSVGGSGSGGGGKTPGAGTSNGGKTPGVGGSGGPGSGGLGGLGGPGAPPEEGGIELSQVPEGIKLTIQDIRFIADSDEFLPAERSRLDRIAEALRGIPQRTFLVEGHTADVGSASTGMDLSIRRAKRMIDELVKRGIGEDRFIYKGWGSSKPVAGNADEAGRRQNRRVEITILE